MKLRNLILLFGAAVLVLGGVCACEEDEAVFVPASFGISNNEIIVNPTAGTYELEVQTNRSCHTELVDDDGWLELSTGDVCDDIVVVGIKYAANDGFCRLARFVVLSDGEDFFCDTITVKQRALKDAIIEFDTSTMTTLAGAGGETLVPLVTNLSFDELNVEVVYTEEGEEWITGLEFTGEEDSDDRALHITYDKNAGATPRSATIKFSLYDGWGLRAGYAALSLLQYNRDEGSFVSLSFEELRNTYATGKTITDYVAITGYVVSNKEQGNAGWPVQTSTSACDFTATKTTVYFESEDAQYGIVIYTDTADDNVFDQFDRATILLTGATVSVKNAGRTKCPVTYELTNFNPSSMVYSRAAGTAPVKKKTISDLTDDDIYTYVTLTDVQIPFRKGALANPDGTYDRDCTSYPCITKTPRILIDKNGDDINMLTNDECLYRRDGTRLPYGSGSISGVIVHEHFARYGSWGQGLGFTTDFDAELLSEDYGYIGRYQLRHQTKGDVWDNMEDDFEKGFAGFVCEYRYQHFVARTEALNVPEGREDTVAVPSYGTNGWLTHTYQTYFGASGSAKLDGTKQFTTSYGYDYLGYGGNGDNAQFGKNWGNLNGLGIVIDEEHENTDWYPGRFAYNKGIEGYYGQEESRLELGCQYSEYRWCGYGSSGWSSSAEDDSGTMGPNGNCGGGSGYRGRAMTGGKAKVDYRTTTKWWDTSTNRFYSFLLYFTTKEITTEVLTLQFSARIGTASNLGPLNWCIEYSTETDSQAESDDDKWTWLADFTIPPSMESGTKIIYGNCGYKQMSFKLPSSLAGQENVWIRMHPTNTVCSSTSDWADTDYLSDQRGISISYLAVRYNKK